MTESRPVEPTGVSVLPEMSPEDHIRAALVDLRSRVAQTRGVLFKIHNDPLPEGEPRTAKEIMSQTRNPF